MGEKKLRPGTCRFCGCTDRHACSDPVTVTCFWMDGRHTLCSACGCPSNEHLKVLRDILTLVCRKATLGELNAWTYPERARALKWASTAHAQANDHPVRVPAMPRHVARLKEIQP
jgi:hypothetical protein